ncbi:MAG: hypothetical protein MJZ60_10425 [Bacteroidaceae bacterium]|nr:hypothetical protein [Bacteroidaceae bacterium]
MDYSDIIDHPHYEPQHHARMPLIKRAYMFAPFAALSNCEAMLFGANKKEKDAQKAPAAEECQEEDYMPDYESFSDIPPDW